MIDDESQDNMSIQEFENEMQDLLGKLDDDTSDLITDKMMTSADENLVDMSPQLDLDSDNNLNECDSRTFRSVDIKKVDQTKIINASDSNDSVEQPVVDVREQFEQMKVVTEEILQGTRADRQEAQDVIILLRSEIDKSIAAGHNPSRMYVDNLVKALEVKTTINMTAVKIMEAKAKLLAATKAGIIVKNNNNINSANIQNGVDQSLMDILCDPLGPDDEF
jgi:hypothetical protein